MEILEEKKNEARIGPLRKILYWHWKWWAFFFAQLALPEPKEGTVPKIPKPGHGMGARYLPCPVNKFRQGNPNYPPQQ